MEEWVRTFAGIFYLLLSTILFGLNGLLLVTMIMNKEFKTKTYRIIKTICFACMMQLFVLAVGGVMTLRQSYLNDSFYRFLGSLIIASWFLAVSMTLTLAVDRLFTFIAPRSKKYSIITNGLTGLCWALWIAVFVIVSIPGMRWSYESYYYWNYSYEPGAQIMERLEPFFDLSIFAVVLLIYLFIFVHLKKVSSFAETKLSKAEMRILFVAVISYIYETVFIACAFYIPVDYTNNEFADIVLNTAWIIDEGMFTILILILNSNTSRGPVPNAVTVEQIVASGKSSLTTGREWHCLLLALRAARRKHLHKVATAQKATEASKRRIEAAEIQHLESRHRAPIPITPPPNTVKDMLTTAIKRAARAGSSSDEDDRMQEEITFYESSSKKSRTTDQMYRKIGHL
ncbi:hypothetical protein QR680_003696 [Steinernema hermaphroditum]|uniref:Uncharacterized protein n=1 Tax=Steinernema hermaphroditum TaxID=289476 RepID=A0AA39LSE1_9BILA|nr:hypothetical protein QR680_003696 [Steinernema hermaphroditum]